MSIGTRLVIFLVVPLVVVMALFGYLSQRSSRQLLEEELSREGRALGRTVQWTMEDAVRDGQLENTRELIDKITGYERVLGLRIFDREGKLYYQSPNLEPYPQRQLASLSTVLKERRSVETRIVVRDQPVVSFFLPLSTPGGDLFGAVQVLQLDSFVQQAEKASNNAVAALTAVMIVAMAAVVLIVTRVSVARPIEDLVRSFRAVGAGDLRSRMIVRREDEFGRLALEFNQMGERLDRMRQSLLLEQEERRRVEERLRNAERLASLGRLAAGLAHEIGTPLNVIGGRAEALLRRMSGNGLAEKHLGIIATQIDRIARIVRGMLDFARARELSLAPTDVAAVIRRVIELLDQRLEASAVEVALDVPPSLPSISADADQLQQVFLNLTTNALDAMPRGGRLLVTARMLALSHPETGGDAREFLAVAFEDSGTGIPRENVNRVFDPFFTTKDVGKGTGLGLSVAYGIAREHGGWMEVASQPGQGARLTVYLPAASVAGQAPEAPARRTA